MSGFGSPGSRRCGAAASPRPSDVGPTDAAAAAHGFPGTGGSRSRRNVPGAARHELVPAVSIAAGAPVAG